jgi:hypothetical protein
MADNGVETEGETISRSPHKRARDIDDNGEQSREGVIELDGSTSSVAQN